MGELTRQRRSRDLWISRGHLWAFGVGVVLLVLCSFFLGLGLSRAGGTSVGSAMAAGTGAPDESLVDLLARVDTRVVAQDGVDTLTFPDTLTGVAEDSQLPEPVATDAGSSRIHAGSGAHAPADLVVPVEDEVEADALSAALRARGWQIRVREGDTPALVIAGGDDVDAARQARERLIEVLEGLDEARPVQVELREP